MVYASYTITIFSLETAQTDTCTMVPSLVIYNFAFAQNVFLRLLKMVEMLLGRPLSLIGPLNWTIDRK